MPWGRVVLTLLLGSAVLYGQPPPEPDTPAQAADRVIAACEADDAATLATLAKRPEPDPWQVAEQLCARRRHGEAARFARGTAAAREIVAYIESVREVPGHAEELETAVAVEGLLDEDRIDEALERTASIEGEPRTLAHIDLLIYRGFALAQAGRGDEGAHLLESAGAAAERIGWLVRAALVQRSLAWVCQQRGDPDAACAALERGIALLERLGEPKGLADALISLGNFQLRRDAAAAARDCYERAQQVAEKAGDRATLAIALENIALARGRVGDNEQATPIAERALALREELGDRAGVARMLGSLASLHEARADYAKALDLAKRALAIQEELGAVHPSILGQLGSILRHLGEYEQALLYLERGAALAADTGDPVALATALAQTGVVHYRLADYPTALAHARRALDLFTEAGDVRGQAFVLGHLGIIAYALGDYPEALGYQERSLALRTEVNDREGMAAALLNLGNVYASTGDSVRALSFLGRALDLYEQVGDLHGAAVALGNIGNIHHESRDYAKALVFHERALALQERIGDRPKVAATLANLAAVHDFLGDPAKALALARRALALFEDLGSRADIASARGNVGVLRLHVGDEGGLDDIEEAIREARWLRATPLLVRLLEDLAQCRLEQDRPDLALARAREASRELEELFAGLGGELSASVRSRHADVYGIGVLAAVREGKLAEALTFLEDGRAGALLEALGGRQALRWTDLPDELRRLESEAQTAHAAARGDYERALATGDREAIRNAADALDAAVQALRGVSERIQREAMRAAAVFYPRAAPLETIRKSLAEHEALVLYAFALDEVVAFVLTRADARAVPLGPAERIAGVCEPAAFVADSEPSAAIRQLRQLLVDPLPLGRSTERVLVSPDGPLGYLPFSLLFDVPVALTPSGTTHVMLRGAGPAPRGTEVLALGDPDYAGVSSQATSVYARGRTLTRLPASREEAIAVGGTVLLGAHANETELRQALKTRRRWRAVHLACHGLVDPQCPTLSSLALSASGGGDGFLSCLEVLRLKVDADLVVLSACETATGRIVAGEGIVGLTRAFMFAGASRVLVSLWRVDDDATRALMVKFSGLWSPRDGSAGLPAAVALRQAQEFVAAQEKWKHPRFWAAWQLWGLAD